VRERETETEEKVLLRKDFMRVHIYARLRRG
jgi:hypothetical protein